MRVVFAIDTLNSGGAQRQAVELAVRLVQRGDVKARFTTYHADDFFRPRLDAAGIEVAILPKPMRYDPLFPRRVRADLLSQPADVIHAFLLAPSLWSLLALRGLPPHRRPLLIAAERNEQIATHAFESLAQRFVYRRVDAVTVNAQPVAAAIEQRLRVPRERIHYIPNGIDLAAWDRAAAAPCPLPIEPGRFHIGLIGRFEPQKNHELLLDALALVEPDVVRSWNVWMIGRGADSAEGLRLRRRAEATGLGGVVRIVSHDRAIAAIMARLSALVLVSRHEGFPNVVLEAMASRLPVVATRVGDVPNMIENGSSGLVISPDARELADALLHVHRLGEKARPTLGEAARARVERLFGMDAVADRYLALYRSLVTRAHGVPRT